MDNFPNYIELITDYRNSFWDSEDIADLNKTLIKTAVALKETNKQLLEYKRKKVVADLDYKKAYRQAIISSNAKTETQKKQMAEIACEELEANCLYINTIIDELTIISNIHRNDLDILKTVGHNLRQEMRI